MCMPWYRFICDPINRLHINHRHTEKSSIKNIAKWQLEKFFSMNSHMTLTTTTNSSTDLRWAWCHDIFFQIIDTIDHSFHLTLLYNFFSTQISPEIQIIHFLGDWLNSLNDVVILRRLFLYYFNLKCWCITSNYLQLAILYCSQCILNWNLCSCFFFLNCRFH